MTARPRRNHDKSYLVIVVARRCVNTLRGQERPVYIAEIPFVDPDTEASRVRVRRHASGSAVPAAAARWTRAPAKRPREKAFTVGKGPQMKKRCQMSLRTVKRYTCLYVM